jgi:hypothetical protein
MPLLGCDIVWVLLIADVSEEHIVSIIRVETISELGTTLAVIEELVIFIFLALVLISVRD